MLTVRWSEDREGAFQASWFDDERAEHGCFVEPFEEDDFAWAEDPEAFDESLFDDIDEDFAPPARPCGTLARRR